MVNYHQNWITASFGVLVAYGNNSYIEMMQNKTRKASAGKALFVTGLILAVIGPAVTVCGLTAHQLMGCSGGGSSGPASGCHIFGIEFNFFAALAMPAFVISFFSVPLGLLLCILGAISNAFSSSRPPSKKVFGIYSPQGKLLQLPEAISVISQFELAECNSLLRSFGQLQSISPESLDSARARCIAAIKSGTENVKR